MSRIPLPVLRDGNRKVLDGVLVAALASSDPAVGGMNVSERQMVVGLFKYGLGLLQDQQSLLGISLLEEKPTLQDAHNGSHGLVPEFGGKFPAFDRKSQRLIVLALHAKAAALPEVGNRQEFFVVDLFLKPQHKIHVPKGLVGGFCC